MRRKRRGMPSRKSRNNDKSVTKVGDAGVDVSNLAPHTHTEAKFKQSKIQAALVSDTGN